MTDSECSPLCGARRAYGPRTRYWHHELRCPARAAEYEQMLQAERERDGQSRKAVAIPTLSADPDPIVADSPDAN